LNLYLVSYFHQQLKEKYNISINMKNVFVSIENRISTVLENGRVTMKKSPISCL